MRNFVITVFLFCIPLVGTEIDSFTLRDPNLQDALHELDAIMQKNFDKALSQVNQKHSCEPEVFENAFHDTIGGVFWSQFEADIESSKTLDKRTLKRSESVYRDINLREGIALYMARLGYVMRIGEFYVGSDKFGHFLETGRNYYNSLSLESALEYGEMTERTFFGLTTTGVYSYGDLAANLEGYSFWQNLAHYVSCENGHWVQKNQFTWGDYVNAAWDEGLNCSYYKNDHVTSSVNQRIADLGMSCPVQVGYCSHMIQRYGYLAPRVITQECF